MSVKAAGLINPVLQFVDASGVPYAGGTLTFYVSGSSSLLQTVYSDSAATVALTNPVSLNAAGRSSTSPTGLDTPVYVGQLPYDIVLKDANGVTVYGPITVCGSEWPGSIQGFAFFGTTPGGSAAANEFATTILRPSSGTATLYAGTKFDALSVTTVGGSSAITEAATVYIAGAPTVSGSAPTSSYALDVAAGAVHFGGDVYSTANADYGSTSTVVGWTSFTTKIIRYAVLGKFVFVAFDIGGTSNTTGASFTLPVASANYTLTYEGMMGETTDNGTLASTPGRYALATNSSTVTCFKDAANATFTNSGTKRIIGQFWYFSA